MALSIVIYSADDRLGIYRDKIISDTTLFIIFIDICYGRKNEAVERYF